MLFTSFVINHFHSSLIGIGSVHPYTLTTPVAPLKKWEELQKHDFKGVQQVCLAEYRWKHEDKPVAQCTEVQ
jgi:hypothetical protein